jgi:hypothetical protein
MSLRFGTWSQSTAFAITRIVTLITEILPRSAYKQDNRLK